MACNPTPCYRRSRLSAQNEHVKGNGWQLQASELQVMELVENLNYTKQNRPVAGAVCCSDHLQWRERRRNKGQLATSEQWY